MNVLFISVDDLRPELGCYGKKYIHTPNIDELASEGRIFKNHFVHSAVCGPSRCTLLSGHRTLNWDIWEEIRESESKPDSIFSLPQLFQENNYKTVCIGKISHRPGGVIDSLQKIPEVPYSWDTTYAPVGKWDDPWKAFFSYAGGDARLHGYGRDDTNHPPFEAADVSDEGYADGLNAKEAIKQLQELKDTRFFLAVGFYKPHLPFNAPQKYWNMYNPKKIPEAEYKKVPRKLKSDFFLHNSFEVRTHYQWPNDTSHYKITEERAEILRHGYAACVSYIDTQIGKVLAELKRLNLHNNTIVVLWGDHGWHLNDYGIWGKITNFDVALRSPLIIKVPGMEDQGVYADGIVETIDIFPTLADLCGLPLPDHLEGISMKPMIDDPDAKIKNYAFSERNYKGYSIGEKNYWDVHGITIRSEQYRLMMGIDNNRDTIEIALYNNFEDPLPHSNIADNHPEIVKKLVKELTNYD